ncbi:hydrogenase maturation nickel metallochaperone HypA [Nitrosomonas sp.]|uniref:hydrogenase maturation nickel metallochaperone HypA n=1 Tax=Nitrosomonas sp. TaxID=42353 RepID=UPI002618A27F|nr:hydrogenase maturation nickel metallochaperone HypA [Nitrosomonas sp.]MCW5600992.1 hydrogenase maturation nickel metallochaperone HypA [Nitrosomonas sp.]
MHEMSLAEEVMQIIQEAAHRQSFARVKTVWLEIGQLACVEQAAFRFCFDIITRDSIAQQARLEILEISGLGWCHSCAQEVPMTTLHDVCLRCGRYGLVVLSGDDLRVKELEVE